MTILNKWASLNSSEEKIEQRLFLQDRILAFFRAELIMKSSRLKSDTIFQRWDMLLHQATLPMLISKASVLFKEFKITKLLRTGRTSGKELAVNKTDPRTTEPNRITWVLDLGQVKLVSYVTHPTSYKLAAEPMVALF